MASPTTGAQLPVCTLLLRAVAIRTSFLHGQAHVGLVARGANLVPFGRALLFGGVASTAGFCLLSRVRLVAANAERVAGFDEACFTLMAVFATDLGLLGFVRQSLVTPSARLMAFVQ